MAMVSMDCGAGSNTVLLQEQDRQCVSTGLRTHDQSATRQKMMILVLINSKDHLLAIAKEKGGSQSRGDPLCIYVYY